MFTPSSTTHHTPGHSGADDRAAEIHREQEREHLRNRIRIKKSEQNDKERTVHDMERELTQLEDGIRHAETELDHVRKETHQMQQGVRQGEGESKQAERGIRDKEQELYRKEEEMKKLERELTAIKAQIAEKESAMRDVKEDISRITKEKEDFRRQHELQHFSAQTTGGHVHEKEVRIQLLEQEKNRKTNDLEHKKQRLTEMKHDIVLRSQDIVEMEAQLKRLG